MLCPKCGAENPASRAFCRSCAQDLWPTLKSKSSTGAIAAAVHAPSVAGMPVATAQRETSSRVESSFDFSGFYGVKGWLLLFCILVTIANPLSAAAEALRIRSVAVTILDAGFAALCICTGYRLWSIKPKSLRWVEIYFVVRLALAAVTLMGAIISKRPALGRDFSLNPSLESGITNVYGTIIWWAYFKKSKRVKATYGRNL